MKILFSCNDVGPARYLYTLSQYGDLSPDWYVSDLVLKHLQIRNNYTSIKDYDLIITGTGPYSFEKLLTKEAKNCNIPIISVIEHWSWYKERFEYKGEMVYPDYIFVNDTLSSELAQKNGIPYSKLVKVGNPWLESVSNIQVNSFINNGHVYKR